MAVEVAGLVTARNVSKITIGLEMFSLYLERAVVETSMLTQQRWHENFRPRR